MASVCCPLNWYRCFAQQQPTAPPGEPRPAPRVHRALQCTAGAEASARHSGNKEPTLKIRLVRA
eukprot:6170514-Pyramimonas_sp.AAC.1